MGRREGGAPADRRSRGKKQSDRTGPDRLGPKLFGSVRTGSVRTGSVRFGPVRFGPVRFGPVRFGLGVFEWCGLDRSRALWTGAERTGPVRTGAARTGPVRTGSDLIGPEERSSTKRLLGPCEERSRWRTAGCGAGESRPRECQKVSRDYTIVQQ